MNTNQHTVTLPIADYQELMDAKANADKRFTELRDRLVKRMEEFSPRSSYLHNPAEFLADIIKTLKQP